MTVIALVISKYIYIKHTQVNNNALKTNYLTQIFNGFILIDFIVFISIKLDLEYFSMSI